MSPSAAVWRLLGETQTVGPSGWMQIITRTYRLPNGEISAWDLLHGGGRTVATLALTPDNQVVLARQYRPGPDLILDELPGGRIEHHEDPEAAAARELLQETGFAGDITLIGSTWLSANAVTQRYVALATNCQHVQGQVLDAEEAIETICKPLPEFRQQLRSGALTDTDLAYMALDRAGLLFD